MKIDIFSHIMPQKYKEAADKIAPPHFYIQKIVETTPTLYDLDRRFQIMDRYAGLTQVLNMAAPPVEMIADSQKAVELARIANDEMAELVFRYPDRFPAAVAW